MNALFNLRVLGAGLLLAAAGALALHGQPDLQQKWAFMAPEYQSRLDESRGLYRSGRTAATDQR